MSTRSSLSPHYVSSYTSRSLASPTNTRERRGSRSESAYRTPTHKTGSNDYHRGYSAPLRQNYSPTPRTQRTYGTSDRDYERHDRLDRHDRHRLSTSHTEEIERKRYDYSEKSTTETTTELSKSPTRTVPELKLILDPPVPNSDVRQSYDLGASIGHGSYATVVKGFCKNTNKMVAVKIIDKTAKDLKQKDKDYMRREVNIMRELSHRHIVSVLEFIENAREICIVMEHLAGENLLKHVTKNGPFTEEQAARYLKGPIEALAYMHELEIAHRDIKPENLVFDSREADAKLKLIDFGFAKCVTKHGALKTPLGTAGYSAAEVVANSAADREPKPYTFSADMFSVGCITYFMLCGEPPFVSDKADLDERDDELDQLVLKGKFEYPDTELSSAAKSFISNLLSQDPAQRMTAEDALKHDFFVENSGSGIPIRTNYDYRSRDRDNRSRNNERSRDYSHDRNAGSRNLDRSREYSHDRTRNVERDYERSRDYSHDRNAGSRNVGRSREYSHDRNSRNKSRERAHAITSTRANVVLEEEN